MADKIPLKLNTGPNEIAEFVTGDTVPVAHLPAATVYTSTTQLLSNKELDSTTKVSSLNSTSSVRALTISSTGGSGTTSDRITITAQATGSGAVIQATSSAGPCDLLIKSQGAGTVKVYQNATNLGDVVGTTGTQTLSGKTLTTPAITDFSSATHTHTTGATGGTLSASAIATGTLGEDRIADTANRSGSYQYGLGNRVLAGDTTIVGSGGSAKWAERERVAQVKVANSTYQASTTDITNYNYYSVFTVTSTAAGDTAFNTLPDCIKESGTVTPFTYAGATSLLGKTIRVTGSGLVRAPGAGGGRTLYLQIYDAYNATSLIEVTAAYANTSGGFTSSYFTFSASIVYRGDGAASGVVKTYLTNAILKDNSGLAASFVNFSDIQNTTAAIIYPNASTITLGVRLKTSAATATTQYIELENCVWEVLN